jgi:superfamily II DNA/RNA helicase
MHRRECCQSTADAGEGINLQHAHLMVNYDLPWNPNRIEQRFGRIHRIGQAEPYHLWNLVADETREGDVYRARSNSTACRFVRLAATHWPGGGVMTMTPRRCVF